MYLNNNFILQLVQVSDWIRLKLAKSVSQINRCLHPDPRFVGTFGGDQDHHEMWLLFEQVPQKLYLPAFQQRHELKFALGDVPSCGCSCPYFTSTRLPCSAMCALLARKGIVDTAQMCPFLHPMWLVKNHPLYPIATRPELTADPMLPLEVSETSLRIDGAAATVPSSQIIVSDSTSTGADAIVRHNADALRNLSIPTDTNGRRAFLNTLFQQVLPGAAASAVATRDIVECFLAQRAKLGNSLSLLAAPRMAISHRQELAGLGSRTEVPNLAVSKHYNPATRHRITTARAKDPSCYVVNRTAGIDQPVQCMCGQIYINNKKVSFHSLFFHAFLNSNELQVAYAHRKTTEHRDWLKTWKAAPAPIPAIASHGVPIPAAADLQVYRHQRHYI